MTLWVHTDEAMPNEGDLCVLAIRMDDNTFFAKLGIYDGKGNWLHYPRNGYIVADDRIVAWSKINGPRLRRGNEWASEPTWK